MERFRQRYDKNVRLYFFKLKFIFRVPFEETDLGINVKVGKELVRYCFMLVFAFGVLCAFCSSV
jgi:hypothetical protein